MRAVVVGDAALRERDQRVRQRLQLRALLLRRAAPQRHRYGLAAARPLPEGLSREPLLVGHRRCGAVCAGLAHMHMHAWLLPSNLKDNRMQRAKP